MSMGRGGYIPPSGPLRFVSLFANIFCVRDFLLLLYCSGCSGDRLFGRGIRILLFDGGSPVFFFVGLSRVRTLRLFRRSGCSVVRVFIRSDAQVVRVRWGSALFGVRLLFRRGAYVYCFS